MADFKIKKINGVSKDEIVGRLELEAFGKTYIITASCEKVFVYSEKGFMDTHEADSNSVVFSGVSERPKKQNPFYDTSGPDNGI